MCLPNYSSLKALFEWIIRIIGTWEGQSMNAGGLCKNDLYESNRLKKFMQVEHDELSMCTKFIWCMGWHFQIWRFCSFEKRPCSFLSDHGLWGQKWNWLKKFMQIEVDVKCMQHNFDERGFFGFGDYGIFVCLQKWPKFSFRIQTMDYSP